MFAVGFEKVALDLSVAREATQRIHGKHLVRREVRLEKGPFGLTGMPEDNHYGKSKAHIGPA